MKTLRSNWLQGRGVTVVTKKVYGELRARKEHDDATTEAKIQEECVRILHIAKLFVMSSPANIPEYTEDLTRMLDVIFGQNQRYITSICG
jgi:hypothetical protein